MCIQQWFACKLALSDSQATTVVIFPGEFWKHGRCWLGRILVAFIHFEALPLMCKPHLGIEISSLIFGLFEVASFGSLFVAPPIGVALGATSAAAGVSSGAGDVVADAEPSL